MKLTIYTDGSACNSRDKKSWGSYGGLILEGIDEGNEENLKLIEKVSGRRWDINSYEAEVRAVLISLNAASKYKKLKEVLIITDCKVISNAMQDEMWIEGWKRKGFFAIRHGDLYELIDQFTNLSFKVRWKHVKGHSGVHWNEEIDKLVNKIRIHGKE